MLSWSDPVKRILFVGLAILLSVHVAAADESGVHVETLSRTGSSWDGNLLPDYPEGNPEITILRITIPPVRFYRSTGILLLTRVFCCEGN